VLCPGLQRTIMMAGESAMEARGIPLSSAAETAAVWAPAIEQNAAHERTAILDLNFIDIS